MQQRSLTQRDVCFSVRSYVCRWLLLEARDQMSKCPIKLTITRWALYWAGLPNSRTGEMSTRQMSPFPMKSLIPLSVVCLVSPFCEGDYDKQCILLARTPANARIWLVLKVWTSLVLPLNPFPSYMPYVHAKAKLSSCRQLPGHFLSLYHCKEELVEMLSTYLLQVRYR